MVPSEVVLIKIGKGRIPLTAEHGLFVARRLRGFFQEKKEGHSDRHSRGLSHHSTGTDAGGLDFRVRDGTG
mgnify:FL=1